MKTYKRAGILYHPRHSEARFRYSEAQCGDCKVRSEAQSGHSRVQSRHSHLEAQSRRSDVRFLRLDLDILMG